MNSFIIYSSLILLILSSCRESRSQEQDTNPVIHSEEKDTIVEPIRPEINLSNYRDTILTLLQAKVKAKQALIVHALVPLCDNEYQGIVPVAKHLGKGRDLKGNLYWACGHGMKAYFKNRHGWKLVRTDSLHSDTILERSVFVKNFSNGAKVYLISDAYAGDQMHACLSNYFKYLKGADSITVFAGQDTIYLGGGADLIGFNGHNGLMDFELPLNYTNKYSHKDAVVVACASDWYFNPMFQRVGVHPLINTTGLLYPGAFVFDDVITQWALLKDGAACRVAAGEAYNRVMKCGRSAGINLFATGW